MFELEGNPGARIDEASGRDSQTAAKGSPRRARTLECLGAAAIEPGPLLDLLGRPMNDPAAVIGTLERSPTLAARVLAVTNSAGFGVTHPIQSLPRAVIHLGASRARAIALAYSLRLLTEELNLEEQVLEGLWRSSLCKAAAARLAADQIDPRRMETAYAAGLIQDVGLAMLMSVEPTFYEQLVSGGDGASWSEQERAHFGVDHGEVGALLLERWNADAEMIALVSHHHDLPMQGSDEQTLAALPTFIAGLLPHLEEPMTATQQAWLGTLHAKFFAQSYGSPESFMRAACEVANPMPDKCKPRRQMLESLSRRLPEAVATDSAALVDQLCRLEGVLARERQHTTTLRYEAFTDPLTHVLNRRGFGQLAERRLDDAVHHQRGVACMVLDLDSFKEVNDRFGHDGGDLFLERLAQLLRENVDRSDLIGRLGGDEFALLIVIDDQAQAEAIAQRIFEACQAERVAVDETHSLPVNLSIGAVFCQKVDTSVELDDLIAAADEAMYQRKRAGKAGVVFAGFATRAEKQ